MSAVVDTATQVTIVNGGKATAWLPTRRTEPAWLRGLAQQMVVATLARDVAVTIRRCRLSLPVFVANISKDMLLGMDVMEHFGAGVDLGSLTLQLEGTGYLSKDDPQQRGRKPMPGICSQQNQDATRSGKGLPGKKWSIRKSCLAHLTTARGSRRPDARLPPHSRRRRQNHNLPPEQHQLESSPTGGEMGRDSLLINHRTPARIKHVTPAEVEPQIPPYLEDL